MTQKEIEKFLTETKVYVNGKSKEIQEKLFSLGYCWTEGKDTKVMFEDKPFLYIDEDHNIAYGCDMVNFIYYEYREISAEEILSLELTEPSYRPFKDAAECWDEMIKHKPFGWIKYKEKDCWVAISIIEDNEGDLNGYDASFEEYTFADGTPFGIKED